MTERDRHLTPPPASSFFERLDAGRFAPTAGAGSPWGPDTQHLGPCSALLARAVEHHLAPGDRKRLARLTVDTLAPVPMEPLRIRVATVKPGRRTELVEAVAEVGDRPVLTARAWCMPVTPADYPSRPGGAGLRAPEPSPRPVRFPGAYLGGYMSAVDWCFAEGGFDELGPARVWARPRIPLLPDEDLSAWQRALTVVDSAYGAALCLDLVRYPVINADLALALYRDPAGDWIGLDTRTGIAPEGGALNTATVYDRTGPVGTATQTLVAQAV
ncbi:thioesterase family protein [Nocardia rhamnosiphila]|uniref:thioesterase family protein n=1 Tax=Nocardia rhamnosiphila TaxID=426716 RepID=UPI0033F56BE2